MENEESTFQDKALSVVLGKKLPFLIKVIDAAEPLSIQVHPDNKWALELENSKGKTECWLILSSLPGAGVYVGLKDHVSEAEFRKAAENKEPLNDLLIFHPVRSGDFICIPAGTIHAIGAGVSLLEVQQASGITYRIWDWGRTNRELHLEKGLKVSNFLVKNGIATNIFLNKKPALLFQHEDFECHFNQSEGQGWFIDLSDLTVHYGTSSASEDYIFVR